MSEIGKLFAQSESRYNGGARIKRQWGSSTVTRFLVGEEGSNPTSWVSIEGFGKTPGDRKTFALEEYKRRYGSMKERELSELKDLLRRFGYEQSHAKKLQAEGMGPHELEERLRVGPSGMGSLSHTHGIEKKLKDVSQPARSWSDLPLFHQPALPPGTSRG